jgi:3-oxoacyl-[acyl-carrier-protein] synthase-3
MLTGVAVLDSFVRNGTVRCGMVVSGEYITSISDNAARKVRNAASPQVASLTVGDSGAAVIVDRAEQDGPAISACEFSTHPDYSQLCIGQPSEDGVGAEMVTSARKLHKHAIDQCVPVIRRALEVSDLRLDEIDFLIPHQTSVRAIRAGVRHIEKEIGSMARSVVENLAEFGNTATTTHFVALERLRREQRLRPEQRVMLLAYASGIVVGSLVFTVGDLGEVRGRHH